MHLFCKDFLEMLKIISFASVLKCQKQEQPFMTTHKQTQEQIEQNVCSVKYKYGAH